MGKRNYSIPLCNELIGSIREASLKVPYRPSRYEDGDILNLNFTTLWPEQKGQARFEIEKFVGLFIVFLSSLIKFRTKKQA